MQWLQRHAITALALALVLTCSSCDGFFLANGDVDHVSVTPSTILLKSTDAAVALTAAQVTVGGTASNVTTTATWTSSNNDVATIDSTGALKPGASTGAATISAKSGGKTGTCNVLVSVSGPGNSLTVNSTNGVSTVGVGSTLQLKAYATLDGVTTDVTNYVTWSSGDTAYATVSSTGVVTGVASSLTTSVTITATGNTASGTVTGTMTLLVQ